MLNALPAFSSAATNLRGTQIHEQNRTSVDIFLADRDVLTEARMMTEASGNYTDIVIIGHCDISIHPLTEAVVCRSTRFTRECEYEVKPDMRICSEKDGFSGAGKGLIVGGLFGSIFCLGILSKCASRNSRSGYDSDSD